MHVSLIAAVAQNGTIGHQNQLPWQIEEDMAFFLRKTAQHVVITGRRNYEAMGAALPGRTNVIVTRNVSYTAPDAQVVTSVAAALRFAKDYGETEAFVIGGAQIYALAFPYADRFYRTRVLADVQGDVRFPELELQTWNCRKLAEGRQSAQNEHPFVIEELSRPEAAAAF